MLIGSYNASIGTSRSLSITKERRCGRPFEEDFLIDKQRLFLPYLFKEMTDYMDTSLRSIGWAMFSDFFGSFTLDPILGTDLSL